MIRLGEFLNRDTLHATSPASHDDLLRELLHRCFAQANETLDEVHLEDLVRTHALKDQSLGKGFALSHARVDALPAIRISVGLLGKPYRFLRREPVHTVFCVLIPMDHSREYLAFLARLGRLLATPGANAVFASADIDRILAFLADQED